MTSIRESLSTVILSFFEIIAGILLLINPISFTAGIIIAAGIVLMLLGLITLVRYFRTKAEEAASGRFMFKALVCLLFGAFCTFRSGRIVSAFPLLTMLYGTVILLTGLAKVQWTADMIRQKKKRWWLAAVGAAVSVVFAVIIYTNPFGTAAVLWMFTGISLIAESIMDIAVMIAALLVK